MTLGAQLLYTMPRSSCKYTTLLCRVVDTFKDYVDNSRMHMIVNIIAELIGLIGHFMIWG